MIIKRFKNYLFFKKIKGEDGEKPSFNLRTMHAINKVSIILFLIGIVFLILKLIIN